MKDKLNYKLVNIFLTIAIICLLYLIRGFWWGILEKIVSVCLPFLVAFVLSYALYPLTKKLENLGLPKWASIAIIYFIIIGFIVILCLTVVPMLYDQTVLFLSNISAVVTDISSKFDMDLGVLQNSLSSVSGDIVKNIGNHLSDGAINFLNTSISVITNLVVVFAASVYFMFDMDKIRAWCRTKLKVANKKLFGYVKMLDHEINNYFRGLVKTIIIQFIEYTLVFALIGHPNFLVLGILASVTNVIPYFGGLIVNILAAIIAAVISPKLFILTLVVCLICPNIDGYIIGPKVYGQTNQLPAIVNIFAVFAGGIIGGFWGIIASLPVAITIIATYKYFKKDIDTTINNIKERKA